jgi:hypothetical protein
MNLSQIGESRVRGYLYMLERSLRASISAPLTDDAVREVESHIRERVAESHGLPNEREALEAILMRFGSPSTVARAYSLEAMLEEAATTARLGAVARSMFHVATMGTGAFLRAFLLFMGYAFGISLFATAVLKPIFPRNVGLWLDGGIRLGAEFPAPASDPLLGYWIIPICIVLGLGVLMLTHRAAHRVVTRMRDDFVSRVRSSSEPA